MLLQSKQLKCLTKHPNKRKIILLFAITVLLISSTPLTSQESINPNFDVSGVKKFWEIIDILQKDKDPSPEEWKSLFDTPGHNALRREFKDDLFIKYFRAAYMPSQIHVREGILEEAKNVKGWFWRWFPKSELEALEWTLKNRDKVVQKMHSLERFPYTEKAVHELLKFLPETQVDDYPNVSFIIFNDSRGYDPVVMSLNLLTKEEDDLSSELISKIESEGHSKNWPHVLYFAHEFFHFYRDKELDFKYPPNDSEDYHLIWLLDQIENEGIADQINTKQLYFEVGCFSGTEKAQAFIAEQLKAADEIMQFNEILTGLYDHPAWKYGLGLQAKRTISRSGHVAGFFMSNIILKHFNKKDLVSVVRNPFQFVYLYNKAAVKEGNTPIFSDKAIAVIKDLENKYSNTNN